MKDAKSGGKQTSDQVHKKLQTAEDILLEEFMKQSKQMAEQNKKGLKLKKSC